MPAEVPAWPLWMAAGLPAGVWAAGWAIAALAVVTPAAPRADRLDGAGVLVGRHGAARGRVRAAGAAGTGLASLRSRGADVRAAYP